MTTRHDWDLQPDDKLSEVLPDNPVIVTSDWERLAEKLRQARPQGARLIEENRYPRAETIALIASERAGEPATGALSPIYLHPPVFIPPMFDGKGNT